MSDEKLARAYDEAMEEIVYLESEIKGWRIRAEKAEADKAELVAVLQKIKNGTWNVKAPRRLNVHDFARAVIAKVSK